MSRQLIKSWRQVTSLVKTIAMLANSIYIEEQGKRIYVINLVICLGCMVENCQSNFVIVKNVENNILSFNTPFGKNSQEENFNVKRKIIMLKMKIWILLFFVNYFSSQFKGCIMNSKKQWNFKIYQIIQKHQHALFVLVLIQNPPGWTILTYPGMDLPSVQPWNVCAPFGPFPKSIHVKIHWNSGQGPASPFQPLSDSDMIEGF